MKINEIIEKAETLLFEVVNEQMVEYFNEQYILSDSDLKIIADSTRLFASESVLNVLDSLADNLEELTKEIDTKLNENY